MTTDRRLRRRRVGFADSTGLPDLHEAARSAAKRIVSSQEQKPDAQSDGDPSDVRTERLVILEDEFVRLATELSTASLKSQSYLERAAFFGWVVATVAVGAWIGVLFV